MNSSENFLPEALRRGYKTEAFPGDYNPVDREKAINNLTELLQEVSGQEEEIIK
jgi:hypothetical protein